jgi:hypothetical protein
VPSGNVLLAENSNSFHHSSPSNYHHTGTSNQEMPSAPPADAFYGTPAEYNITDPQTATRYINGRPVKAKNAHLPDAVLVFKEKRKQRTVLASCTGGVVGFFTLGPLGAVIGATGGYAAAKSVGKVRERKLLRKCTSQQQQNHAAAVVHTTSTAPIHSAEVV